jgi:hypothetical protein
MEWGVTLERDLILGKVDSSLISKYPDPAKEA